MNIDFLVRIQKVLPYLLHIIAIADYMSSVPLTHFFKVHDARE